MAGGKGNVDKHSTVPWPHEKRLEVVATYLKTGNAVLTEGLTKVPQNTIRQWKTQPWWKDMVLEIQNDQDIALNASMEGRITKVMDVVSDRLENGEFVLNKKTGEIQRVPVIMKDAWKVGKEMLDIRRDIQKDKVEVVNQQAVGDILKSLAQDFAKIAKQKRTPKIIEGEFEEVVDATELQAGVQELPRDGNSEETPSLTEQSPSGNVTGGESS